MEESVICNIHPLFVNQLFNFAVEGICHIYSPMAVYGYAKRTGEPFPVGNICPNIIGEFFDLVIKCIHHIHVAVAVYCHSSWVQ
ncbi:hypothetical protein D3C81_1841200 [compost metagenome]